MSGYGGQPGDAQRKLGDRQRRLGPVAVLLSFASMAFAFAQGVLGELAALILGPPWLAGLAVAFLVLALGLALAALVVAFRRPDPGPATNPDTNGDPSKPGHWRRIRRHLRWWLPAVASIVVIVYAVPPIWSWAEIQVSGCSQPTELRVMTSPDLLGTYQRLGDAYEQWTADRNHDCPTANLYVYAVPTDHAIDALGSGWIPEDPDSDGIGRPIDWPRPDVWLAESRLDVDRMATDLPGADIEHVTIASTPLVVAFFGSEAATPAPADDGWAGWWRWLEERGWGPLRPDPTVSATGQLANAAIYLSQDVITYGGDGQAQGDLRRAADLERGLIASFAGDVKEPRGADETAVLCDLVRTPATTAAAVLSKQMVEQHRRGRLSGGACATGQRGTSIGEDVDLRSFPPDGGLRIYREFVQLKWDDAADPQEEVAEEFRTWLTSDEEDAGQSELRDVGLEAPPQGDFTPPWLELPDSLDRSRDDLAPLRSVVREARDLYQQVRRPARVLVLLDLSGSMGEAVGDTTTFALASDGVRETLDLMSDRDQFILWGFPDPTGAEYVPLLTLADTARWGDLSPDQRQDALDAVLSRIEPNGGTPLFDALTEAIKEVGPEDDEQVSAVVVLTDGEDTGESSIDDVIADVDDADVRIYAVAVGEADCGSSGLETLAAETGGACQEPSVNDTGEVLRDMLGDLWGGDGEGTNDGG